jgi:hypothetical protein
MRWRDNHSSGDEIVSYLKIYDDDTESLKLHGRWFWTPLKSVSAREPNPVLYFNLDVQTPFVVISPLSKVY